MNTSTPGSPVKGAHVVVDGERFKESFPLSLEETLPGKAVFLDRAHGPPAKAPGAKDSAATSGK